MALLNIPKEYILEDIVIYDEWRFKMHLSAVLTIAGYKEIYAAGNHLLSTFFRANDHYEITLDLIRWIIDLEPNATTTIITKRLIAAMYEAGFFG